MHLVHCWITVQKPPEKPRPRLLVILFLQSKEKIYIDVKVMNPNFQSLCLTHVFFKTELCWNLQVIWSMFTLFFQSYKSSTINGMFLNYYFQWYIGTIHIYIHIYIYMYVYIWLSIICWIKLVKVGILCLDPDLRGTTEYDVSDGLVIYGLIMLKYISFGNNLLRYFF